MRETRTQGLARPLEHTQTTIDRVRMDFPDGWALIRSSVTEPALTFRFEAADLGGLRELIRPFRDTLEEVGDELWARYEAAAGSHASASSGMGSRKCPAQRNSEGGNRAASILKEGRHAKNSTGPSKTVG